MITKCIYSGFQFKGELRFLGDGENLKVNLSTYWLWWWSHCSAICSLDIYVELLATYLRSVSFEVFIMLTMNSKSSFSGDYNVCILFNKKPKLLALCQSLTQIKKVLVHLQIQTGNSVLHFLDFRYICPYLTCILSTYALVCALHSYIMLARDLEQEKTVFTGQHI